MGIPEQPSVTPPAPKKKRKWPWIVAGVVVVIVVLAAVSGKDEKKDTPAAAPSSSREAPPPLALPTHSGGDGKKVTYEVTSDGPLSTVTYYDELNDMKQLTDQPATWSTSFEGKATFQLHSLGAQTKGTQVSCRITVAGSVVAEESATGRYAVVNCAG